VWHFFERNSQEVGVDAAKNCNVADDEDGPSLSLELYDYGLYSFKDVEVGLATNPWITV
jgi:hypothetical protein